MAIQLALIPLIDKVIDSVTDLFPTPQKKAEAKIGLQRALVEGKINLTNSELQAIVAEANSDDKWTSRARPSFLYVVYLYLLFGIPIGILSVFNADAATQIATGMGAWFNAIPTEMWVLFGTGYLGYTGARTWDKDRKRKQAVKEKETAALQDIAARQWEDEEVLP